ncbi:flagellar protein FlgN [Aquibacillus kalidii]|uniref:flagellar protein FlgN n=1 Tax=Aquibacillus kalidii TaxID=2762597 RepID=UPI001645BE23|nr:flagellar protein FlgN [Aquibacillus kalidii]
MSVQSIIDTLQKIAQLHQSLLNISEMKTDVLKKGDTDELQKLLKQEQKHAQAINQLENARLGLVEKWGREKGIDSSSLTVSEMLDNHLEGPEKRDLEDVTVQLAEVLVKLKQQEDLNQQLTQQSLQFIQLSMDMINPGIKNINYGVKHTKQASQTSNRSVFDSKA